MESFFNREEKREERREKRDETYELKVILSKYYFLISDYMILWWFWNTNLLTFFDIYLLLNRSYLVL